MTGSPSSSSIISVSRALGELGPDLGVGGVVPEVGEFLGVGFEVVELAGPAGAVVGELVARGDEDFLADDGLAGVAFDADAFDDDGVAVDVGFPLQQGGEGAAFHAGEGRGAGEVDDGGDQVKCGSWGRGGRGRWGPRGPAQSIGTRMTDS